MFYWSESFTSLIRFWQPQFDGLTRLTLTPLDFTTDLRHCVGLLSAAAVAAAVASDTAALSASASSFSESEFQLSADCPPLHFGATFSVLAFSVLAFSASP